MSVWKKVNPRDSISKELKRRQKNALIHDAARREADRRLAFIASLDEEIPLHKRLAMAWAGTSSVTDKHYSVKGYGDVSVADIVNDEGVPFRDEMLKHFFAKHIFTMLPDSSVGDKATVMKEMCDIWKNS